MQHIYNISENQQVESWLIKTDNNQLDVCNIANQLNLSIFINLDAPLGLYRESERRILLQNPKLDFFSFWIFLHELGHHKNTLSPDSKAIQGLYTLKKKDSLQQKVEFLNKAFEIFNINPQKVFGSSFETWREQTHTYFLKSNELNSISNIFFGINRMPHNQFLQIANSLRIDLNTIHENIEEIFELFKLNRYLQLPLAVSELLAWSHALRDIQRYQKYFSENLLDTRLEFYSLKTQRVTRITPIEFMCKTLKSHSTQTIFESNQHQCLLDYCGIESDLENLIKESQFYFQDFIALSH